jgi:hypothetical protein
VRPKKKFRRELAARGDAEEAKDNPANCAAAITAQLQA